MCKTESNNNKPLNSNSIKTLNTIKMKKMKKSLLTLLTAILIGSTFTSCVENTIPDEVVAIYDGQANLLAAQAALLAAEANAANAAAALTAAQTAHEQAKTAALTAATAISQANNTAELERAAAELAHTIAQNAANLADQQAKLARETAKFAADAAEAQAKLEIMVAANVRAADLAAAELAALIAENDTKNAAAIAAMEIKIAIDADRAAKAEADLAAQIAQEAERAATAAEALANTIAANILALAKTQEELDNLVANNAITLQVEQAKLDAILAQAIIDAANAERDLIEASAQLNLLLEQIAIQVETLNDTELTRYFTLWSTYSGLEVAEQAKLIIAQLAVIQNVATTAANVRTDATAIAGFNALITTAETTKAGLLAANVTLNASMAAGTTLGDNEAKRAAQVALLAANVTLISGFDVLVDELQIAINAQQLIEDGLVAGLGLATARQGYIDEKDLLVLEEAKKAGFTAANTALATDITAFELAITEYDALTITLKATVTSTAAAATAAATAKTAADTASAAAIANNGVQVAALTTLQAATAGSRVALNDAADALDLAIFNVNTSTTQNRVDAAVIALAAAQTAYTAAQVNFDDKSKQYTWTAGLDGRLGTQADGPQAAVQTYAIIQSIALGGSPAAPTYTGTFSANVLVQPVVIVGTNDSGVASLFPLDVNSKENQFIEFGIDDVVTKDVDVFTAATTALEAADAELVAANAANTGLPAIVVTAQATYDAATTLFENRVALEAAQVTVAATALALVTTTATAATTAAAAATVATAAAGAATTAENAHKAKTVKDYQDDIELAQVTIANNNNDAALSDILIAGHKANITAFIAKLDAGKTAELLAAEAAGIAMDVELIEKQGLRQALLDANDIIDNTLLIIGTPATVTVNAIAANVVLIATADGVIAFNQAAITAYPGATQAQRDALHAANFANLTAVVKNIETTLALYAELSATYKDLVDSLL